MFDSCRGHKKRRGCRYFGSRNSTFSQPGVCRGIPPLQICISCSNGQRKTRGRSISRMVCNNRLLRQHLKIANFVPSRGPREINTHPDTNILNRASNERLRLKKNWLEVLGFFARKSRIPRSMNVPKESGDAGAGIPTSVAIT